LLACSINVCGREHESKSKVTILDILKVWQSAAVKIPELFSSQSKQVSMPLTTALFIAAIITVWNSIALVCLLYALLQIGTLELCC